MGHTRLGPLPKTKKWNDLVEQVSGSLLAGFDASPAASSIDLIASQTLQAARSALSKAARDPGVRYTFYLLTQVALASRSSDWQAAVARHGMTLSGESSVFDVTVEMQSALDRHVGQTTFRPTDLSEMAQQSAGEALMSLAETRTVNLFGASGADTRNAIRSLSTRKGFGELGQRFFGRFVARFLNFYLSRATAASLGRPRLPDIGDIAQFNDALQLHCEQSARIVRDFCGEWYSKTEHEEGIDLSNTSRFLAVAIKKLRSELEQQGGES